MMSDLENDLVVKDEMLEDESEDSSIPLTMIQIMVLLLQWYFGEVSVDGLFIKNVILSKNQ